ncbi:MAG: DUF413 domain-containing protein [Pseudomonadales bacterium]|nr:DUF413 domain-containing protein [Pseudomonadales bacterium]
MDIRGFEAGSQFQDSRHFPVGFSRSGEFTLHQAEILEQYGHVLKDLENGQQKAKGREQKHFIAVCSGSKEAESMLEKAWLKYRTLTHVDTVASAFGQLKSQSLEEARVQAQSGVGAKHTRH